MTATTDRQTQLKKFIARRHPLYEAMAPHWIFLQHTYEGGRQWFGENIWRYIKEGDLEYKQRVDRAYRFNHTREVVDLVDKYLFKMEVTRSDKAPQALLDFWKNTTLFGSDIEDFMRSVSSKSSTFGRVWAVVDSTRVSGAKTIAAQKAAGARVYSYLVTPQDFLDASYDENGKLNWALIHEIFRDDEDPIVSNGRLQDRYRLWTREFSQVFNVKLNESGKVIAVIEGPQITHGLGVVPVIAVDCTISEDKWTSPAMIADVAYLDRACANYLSNLDAIIQDQTFSQLAMPAQGLSPGEDAYKKLLELGTKRVFIYDGGEGSNQPFYISPDVKQAEIILKVVNKIINEIYHSIGLAGERTKEDNAMGIDNSSGVAKAYDFERVNSLLAAKAESLESFEERLARMVLLYSSIETEDAGEYLEYPDDFDVRGLYDEFEIAARLALIDAPDTMRRTQMEQVIDKLFPLLKQDLRDAMTKDLKSWPPVLIDPATGSPTQGLQKAGTQALTSKLAKSDKAAV